MVNALELQRSNSHPDRHFAQFSRFRRYINRDIEDTGYSRPKRHELTPNTPWQSSLPNGLPEGTYLYVVLPPTLRQPLRVRLSLLPVGFMPHAADTHVELAQEVEVVDGKTKTYVAAPISAGEITFTGPRDDLEILGANLNSGHFKPGERSDAEAEMSLKATKMAFELCQLPVTSSTIFSGLRNRGE